MALGLEVDRHFIERIGNVLICFDADLRFHRVVGQTRRHVDDLGNHGGTGNRNRHILQPGLGANDHVLECLRDRIDFGNVLSTTELGGIGCTA